MVYDIIWYLSSLSWLCNCHPNPSPFYRHHLLRHIRMMWHNRSLDWWFIRLSAYVREMNMYQDISRWETGMHMSLSCERPLCALPSQKHALAPYARHWELDSRIQTSNIYHASIWSFIVVSRLIVPSPKINFYFRGEENTGLKGCSYSVEEHCAHLELGVWIFYADFDLWSDQSCCRLMPSVRFCQLTWMVLMTVRVSDQPPQLELALEMAWKNYLCYL